MTRIGVRSRRQWSGSAIALHELRAVYYVVPKVACSSLLAVCVDLLDFDLPEGSWKPGVFRDARFDDIIDIEVRDAAKVSSRKADSLRNYWRFAFVRNPYDRLVSCYSEKIRDNGPEAHFIDGVGVALQRFGCFYRGMSFSEFARAVADIPDQEADDHFRSQWTFVCNPSGQKRVDYLGRFETLAEDVIQVGRQLGRSVDLPHLLKSARKSFEAYYDDSTREIVRRRYAEDFEILQYAV